MGANQATILSKIFTEIEGMRIDFAMLNNVDILNTDVVIVKEVLEQCVRRFQDRHGGKCGQSYEFLRETFYTNIIYIAGYYGPEEAKKWRAIVRPLLTKLQESYFE
jgi:hypothetical protein